MKTKKTKNKINIGDIIAKLCLFILFILFILIINSFISNSFFSDYNLLNKNYYDMYFDTIILILILSPTILIPLIYLIVYKVKYKTKIIKNKVVYIIAGILLLISICFNIYRNNNTYRIEVINTSSQYSYYIYLVDKNVNVERLEQIQCVTTPCDPVIDKTYNIKFSENSMNKIYKYITTLSDSKENSKKITIDLSNINNNEEKNIIYSIIYNDEKYINN